MAERVSDKAVTEEINRLRAHYQELRDQSTLSGPADHPVIGVSVDLIDNVVYMTNRYENSECIRLADITGALFGDTIRLKKNIPPLEESHKIVGNETRCLDKVMKSPEDLENDSEDLITALNMLPVIEIDSMQHFPEVVKHGSKRTEITQSSILLKWLFLVPCRLSLKHANVTH